MPLFPDITYYNMNESNESDGGGAAQTQSFQTPISLENYATAQIRTLWGPVI